MFGSYHIASEGDVDDDEYERFLQWCDDRGISLVAQHYDFNRPLRRYGSYTFPDDIALEMRMTWPFVKMEDHGGW